jgi:hypothetical protein
MNTQKLFLPILILISLPTFAQIKVDTFYIDGPGDSQAEFSKELSSASPSKKHIIFHRSIARREASFLDTVSISEMKFRFKQTLKGDTLFPAYSPRNVNENNHCRNIFSNDKYRCLGWTLSHHMRKIISLNNGKNEFTIDFPLDGQLRWDAITFQPMKLDGPSNTNNINRLETFLFQRDLNHQYVVPKSIKNSNNRHYTLLLSINSKGMLHVEPLLPAVLDATDKTLLSALNKAVEAFPAWSFRYLYTSDGRCFPARIYDVLYLSKGAEWNFKDLSYNKDAYNSLCQEYHNK